MVTIKGTVTQVTLVSDAIAASKEVAVITLALFRVEKWISWEISRCVHFRYRNGQSSQKVAVLKYEPKEQVDKVQLGFT